MKNKILSLFVVIFFIALFSSCSEPTGGIAVVSDGDWGITVICIHEDTNWAFYEGLYGSLRNDDIDEKNALMEVAAMRGGEISFRLKEGMFKNDNYEGLGNEDVFNEEINSGTSKFYIVVNDPESEHYLSDYETVKIKCDSSLYPDDDGDPLTITLKAKEK